MQTYYDSLCVKTYDSREEMGAAAAKDAAACLKKLLEEKEEVSCMFAAAPSQNEFLEALHRKRLKVPSLSCVSPQYSSM